MTANPIDDQFDAATNEAADIFAKANGRLDTVERSCDDGSIGAAITQRFQDSLETPQARCCPHILDGPQPAYAYGALPGLMGCMNCMGPLITAKQLMERMEGNGRVCDGCGDRVEQWHDSLIQRGPLLLLANVCCFCMSMSELEHPDHAQETD
jgi:hypothetical protein